MEVAMDRIADLEYQTHPIPVAKNKLAFDTALNKGIKEGYNARRWATGGIFLFAVTLLSFIAATLIAGISLIVAVNNCFLLLILSPTKRLFLWSTCYLTQNILVGLIKDPAEAPLIEKLQILVQTGQVEWLVPDVLQEEWDRKKKQTLTNIERTFNNSKGHSHQS